MIVFRWIIGLLSVFFAVGAAFSFALFVSFDTQLWLRRARSFRHWLWLVLLFWFNVEVWGKVIWTIWRWNK